MYNKNKQVRNSVLEYCFRNFFGETEGSSWYSPPPLTYNTQKQKKHEQKCYKASHHQRELNGKVCIAVNVAPAMYVSFYPSAIHKSLKFMCHPPSLKSAYVNTEMIVLEKN